MQHKTCPKCGVEKPVSDFWTRKTRKELQPASRCKICSTQSNREWREKNPSHEKQRYAKIRVETRERHLVRKYGVDLAAYRDMLKAQGGTCFICAKAEADENHGVLHVDHCHASGAVRGLLCRNCNHVLGLMRDRPDLMRRAADYLERPQIPELIGHAIARAEGLAA